MPIDEAPRKICLSCARRKLAKKKLPPCGDCALLNVDKLAKVRAAAALPSPLAGFTCSPYRALPGAFAVLQNHQIVRPAPTGWERGE